MQARGAFELAELQSERLAHSRGPGFGEARLEIGDIGLNAHSGLSKMRQSGKW